MNSSLHPATSQKLLADIRGILGQGFKQLCCKLDREANASIASPQIYSGLGDDSDLSNYSGHTFTFFKNSAQDISITTLFGEIRIPPGQTVYNTPVYQASTVIEEIWINAGGGTLRDIFVIIHKLY